MIGPAREDIIFDRAIRKLEPYQQTGARVAQQFELDGSACLLLDDKGACSEPTAGSDVTDLHPDKVSLAYCAATGRLK